MSQSYERLSHTPGPWFVGAQNDTLYVIDRRPNATQNDYPDHDANREPVCKVYDTVRVPRDGEANARLIAAAPDLLEAVRTIVEQHTEGCISSDAFQACRIALAKAEGR